MRQPSRFASKAPAAPSLRDSIWSLSGAFLAIATALLLSQYSATPWLMLPFGATCVLLFATPDSPLAQPRSVIGGHLIAAFIALLLLWLFGQGVWAQALAVGLSILAMQQSRTLHAPAGATPLVVMTSNPNWEFLLFPVLTGASLMVVIAWGVHQLRQRGSYPKYWW